MLKIVQMHIIPKKKKKKNNEFTFLFTFPIFCFSISNQITVRGDKVNIQAEFTIKDVHHCLHFSSLLNDGVYSSEQPYNTSNLNCD